MKVKEMLEIDALKGCKIIAGNNGASREVASVSVMDAPDIHHWVRKGDFLITSGYLIKDNSEILLKLLENIDAKEVAALGIKVNRFLKHLPEDAARMADQLQLPIIFIPNEFAFTDIINPVLSDLVNRQAELLAYSEKIQKTFTSLVIRGSETQDIINVLAESLNKKLIFYDLFFKKFYVSSFGEKASEKELPEKISEKRLTKLLDENFHHKLEIYNRNYGYLIFLNENPEDTIKKHEFIAIEHALTTLKLDIQKKISNKQVEEKYRNEFVRDILINNITSIEEIRHRASLYDWQFEKQIRVVVFDIDDFKRMEMESNHQERIALYEKRDWTFRELNRLLRRQLIECYYSTFSDSIVFMYQPGHPLSADQREPLDKACRIIQKEIRNKSQFTLMIGIGSKKESVLEAHESYQEAINAIKFGRIKYKQGSIVFFDDLGSMRLLSLLHDSREAREFVSTSLDKLISFDRKNDTNFLETLMKIIENDWNYKAAARDMYIHYNTMKYRIKRIEKILKVDFRNSEEKLDLMLAVKLNQIIK